MKIDDLIKRLEDLRSIAKHGGETRCTVDFDVEIRTLEGCIAELQPCSQLSDNVFKVDDDDFENNTEVVRIF